MLPLLLLSALAQAPATRIDDRPVTVAVQTDDGVLHAIRGGRVARFDDGWREVGGPTSGDAVALAAEGDRGVVALWRAPGGAELWRHSKKEPALVARLPLVPQDPKLVVQRDGTTWLTGSTRRLVRIARDGSVSTHVLEAGWLVTPEMKSKPACLGLTEAGCCEVVSSFGQASCGSVQGFEREGVMWFWSTGSSNSFVLKGLLSFSSGHFTPWTSPGLPEAVTRTTLALEHHALLSADGALYRLDLKTRTVAPEPFPPLKEQTPQDILGLHRSDTATWALAQRSFQQREGQLFRSGPTGFVKVLDGVGGVIYPFMKSSAFASAKHPDGTEHVWLAAPEGPLWHFGLAEPELVDWASGLNVGNITGIFATKVSSKRTALLFTGANGTFRMPIFEAAPAPPTQLVRFPVQRRAFTWSPDGRLFWLEGVEPVALQEWTGAAKVTRTLPRPPRDAFTSASTVVADEADVWIVADPSRGFSDQGPEVARFTFGGRWTIHADAAKALAADVAKATAFHGLDVDALLAVARDGARCMRDPNRKLSCAWPDGRARRWAADDVSGVPSSSFWTSPSTNADGELVVVVNRLGKSDAWRWTGKAWEPTSTPATPSPRVTVPQSCTPHTLVMQGVDGRAWFGSRDGLMVARNGVCRMRRSGLALDGVSHARFDARGHDVLVRGDEVIILTDVERFPETAVGKPTQKDRVVSIEVRGASVAELRIDGGAWNAHELINSVLSIPGLTVGTHHLEVRALDDQLRADPTPAVVDVVVR